MKMQKKKSGRGVKGLGGVVVGWGEGRGGWSGGGDWLVVTLGVGGDVGYGGCEPRIERIVQCT